MIPISITTYSFDINKANAGSPSWEVLHSFTHEYNLEDLSPDSISKLSEQIKSDEQVAIQYECNKSRKVEGIKPVKCDEECRLDKYCYVSTTEYFQKQTCKGRPEYDFKEDPGNALINFMVSNWIKKEDKVLIKQ